MCPSRSPKGKSRGWIIPVGGAEVKENNPQILSRFVALCGGAKARIAIIPTASKLLETGPKYERIFKALGVKSAVSVDFEQRSDASDPERLAVFEGVTGVFLTGGSQLRLATLLGGTPVARKIRELNAHGVHVCGTSAGASFLSEHMIAFGEEGATPIAGNVRLAPGLGLTNRFIIDQHFRQRDRLGRLTAALAYNPFAIGIGLDEDSAAFISPDQTLEVGGSGAVTVVDATDLEFSSMDQADEGQPVCMLGLRIHILIAGSTFNLHTRLASPGKLVTKKK
ncbi:MAG TPA: cyanophycinase [Arenimonas sp.]|nr:cyanophycinase [Arenimonas sp.]